MFETDSSMKCPYCQSTKTFVYYKTNQPSILSACPAVQLSSVKNYPFEATFCCDCGLGFNSSQLSQTELHEIYDNYLYVSPLNNIGHTAFNGIKETIKKYCSEDDKIVEIGCSEGFLLNELRNSGYNNLMGIEPGPQAECAMGLGFHIIKGYFGEKDLNLIPVDAFLLVHVFEHFQDPFIILQTMKSMLSDKGRIIIEVPDFGGYHHQHLFFFNLAFMKRLCEDTGLKLINIQIDHDASRFVIVKKDNYCYETPEIKTDISREIVRAKRIHNEMQQKINSVVSLFKKSMEKKIFWWGAGSLSVILLNQLERKLVEDCDLCIIDGDSAKEGFFIPGINLPVSPVSLIAGRSIETLIIASSYHNEIMQTIKDNKITVKDLLVIDA